MLLRGRLAPGAPGASATRPASWRAARCSRGGILTILVALVSPLDSLGDQLMVMHMVQHMLLLDIAPILLILRLTKGCCDPVTRRVQAVERRAGFFAHPAFAVILYVGVMWLWHVPGALRQGPGQQHASTSSSTVLLRRGSLYWWHVLSPIRSRAAPGRPGSGRLHGRRRSCWSGCSGSRSRSRRP